MPTSPPEKALTVPPTPRNVADFEKRAEWLRAKKAHEEDPKRFPPPPPRPDCFDDSSQNHRAPFSPVHQPASQQTPLSEPAKRVSAACANTAHSPNLVLPHAPPPILPAFPVPISSLADGTAVPTLTQEQPPATNPVGSVFTPPNAPPLVVPPVNPVTPEPTPAPRLAAVASVSGDPVPPEAATHAAGREQGVTSDASNASSVNLAFRSLRSQKGGNGDEKPSPDTAGPDDGDTADMRVRGVTARVTDAEYAQLKADAKRRRKRMGALLRLAYFDRGTAVVVPELNQKKWAELARGLNNVNQIAHYLNMGTFPGTDELRPLLAEVLEGIHGLRADLVGTDKGKKGGAK